MNLQYSEKRIPLKVIVVNPLANASQLTVVKILSGIVFGKKYIIDLILLVYTNEVEIAEAFKLNLKSCAFSCMNSIGISTFLPSVSDADVFIFITNFPNPNYIDFTKVDSNEKFDTFYLIIKIAHNFSIAQSNAEKPLEMDVKFNEQHIEMAQRPRTPIFIADGLAVLDILKYFSRNIPDSCFFCPSSLTSISKSVLGEYLKAQSKTINNVLVWAANDEVFHVEVERPLIVQDKFIDDSSGDWDISKKDVLQSTSLDYTQFNDSWMKKEFIERIKTLSCKNPYGCIYKAAMISKTLQAIWEARSSDGKTTFQCSVGIISDGSLGTLKGYPYVLPVVFSQGSWNVNKKFEKDTHLQLEIKRINKAAKEHHQKLIRCCKKFLEDNVIKQVFIPDDDSSVYSMIPHKRKSDI